MVVALDLPGRADSESAGCSMLYTVLSNIAFILFESNAYPGPLTEAAACAEPEFKEYFNV